MATRPSLPGEYPPVLLKVRERLKGQYTPVAGYQVRPGSPDQPFDLEVCLRTRPVHYFVIHDGGRWEDLCERMGRCIELAQEGSATAWLAVPDASVMAARGVAPRVCSYREDGGELFFQWW